MILLQKGRFTDKEHDMTALVTEVDIPDSDCIDPADYPDTTAYLNAIPGAVERLLAYRNLPDSEFTPIPREYFSV